MLECIVISPGYGEWNMDLVSSNGSVLIFYILFGAHQSISDMVPDLIII